MEGKIYFKNTKGQKLCGILSNPTADNIRPVIIICHGFATSKETPVCARLQQILNKKDISTLRFDFFGHNESKGDFKDITISEAVDDILNAIKYLKDRKYSKIGLVGSSFGGTAGIMTASKTDDLFILALKSPVSNFLERDTKKRTKEDIQKWKDDGYIIHTNSKGEKRRLNYTFFEDFKNNDGYEAAKKIKIPTIIVHGEKDERVPIEQSIKTAGIIKDCKLEIIENSDHIYSKPEHFKKMLEIISKFIIRHCQETPST